MNSTLPQWRASAPPGISLAAAMARHPVESLPTASSNDDLMRILRPEVRPRWRNLTISQYTPQQVETILRNAIMGELSYQWELFDIMEDTWDRLAKNLGELKRAVQSYQWRVEPWTEDDAEASPDAVKRAKLVSHVLWRMRPDPAADERAFPGIIEDLLDAWGKGISVVELVWEQRQVKEFGTIWAVQSGAWVHPMNYALDATGRLGIKSGNGPVQQFPEHKFLIAIAKAKTAHFCCSARLRALAWWWAASNFSSEWLLNCAQVFGVPIRWATYPATAAQGLIDKIGDALENMGSAGWAAFPEGTNLNILDQGKTSGQSPQDGILDRADRKCDLLILGQTLTSDAGDRGTQALGTVHWNVRSDVVDAAARFVEEVVEQQLVPAILQLNFDDTELCPEICAEPRRQEDRVANAERDKLLIDIGLPLPKNWLYERHDVPIPAEGEEVVEGRTLPAAISPQDASGGNPALPQAGADSDSTEAKRPPTSGQNLRRCPVHAEASDATANDPATEQLIDHVMESLTGIQAKWLAGVRPFFEDLIRAAQDETVSDADFEKLLAKASAQMPELFDKLDHAAIQDALEGAMGAAVVNGAVSGAMQRRVKAS